MKSTTELVVDGVPGGKTPSDMIMAALSGGADLEKLEKLLDIQERWEKNEARKAFASCFAMAQSNIGSVIKTKFNAQTKSKYADLSDVIDTAKPEYTKEGFSVIFYEGDTPLSEHTRVYADVLHKSGHKETYHFDVPLDGKGIQGNANMTKIHGKASSVAYGRRYLMCMIWNIPTADNDGNTEAIELIGNRELHIIRDLLIAKELSESGLAKYMGVEKIEDIKASDYMKALAAINAKKKDAK